MVPQPGSQSFWITIALVALVVLRYLSRELRDRRIRTGYIYVWPAIFAVLTIWLGATAYSLAPNLAVALVVGVAAALPVGALLGLAIIRNTSVRSAGPGQLILRGSWTTVAIWLGAFVLRFVARYIVGTTAPPAVTLMLNTSLVALLGAAFTTVRLRALQIARESATQ